MLPAWWRSAPGSFGGRYIHFGVREHGMAAAPNGMALHGGLLPYVGSFFVFTDYMRPALRLAAMMRQRVIYVLTHDWIGLGEDGPTHQPVEQLAACARCRTSCVPARRRLETAECWELAVRRADGPSLIVLSRQTVPRCAQDAAENRCARGGYVMLEADGPRRATLIATGSEVSVARRGRELLAEKAMAVAVVSLPCWELFAQQTSVPADGARRAPRVGIEAACGFGWERWLGESGCSLG